MVSLKEKQKAVRTYRNDKRKLCIQAAEIIKECDEEKAKEICQEIADIQEPLLAMYANDLCEAVNPIDADTAVIAIAALDNMSAYLKKKYPTAASVAEVVNQLRPPEAIFVSVNTENSPIGDVPVAVEQ